MAERLLIGGGARYHRVHFLAYPGRARLSLAIIGLLLLGTCIARAGACPLSQLEAPSLDTWKFVLSVVGYVGALSAFGVGLRQYWRADYWKRSEFLAKEMKDYFADPKVSIALTLIDWGVRFVNLGVKAADATVEHRVDETLVDRDLQCAALRPHTLLSATGASDAVARSDSMPSTRATPGSNAPSGSDEVSRSVVVSPSDSSRPDSESSSDAAPLSNAVSRAGSLTSGGAAFKPEEAAIRDSYDRFLDGLDRFGNYLSGELVSVVDLQPYLGYWIADIANTECDGMDAMWSLCLLAYIEFYAFTGVKTLFAEFGYDIGIDGDLVKVFLVKVSDPKAATAVMDHIRAAKERRFC